MASRCEVLRSSGSVRVWFLKDWQHAGLAVGEVWALFPFENTLSSKTRATNRIEQAVVAPSYGAASSRKAWTGRNSCIRFFSNMTVWVASPISM